MYKMFLTWSTTQQVFIRIIKKHSIANQLRLTILQATHTDRAGSGFVNTTFSTPNMNTNVISVMTHGPDGNVTIAETAEPTKQNRYSQNWKLVRL